MELFWEAKISGCPGVAVPISRLTFVLTKGLFFFFFFLFLVNLNVLILCFTIQPQQDQNQWNGSNYYGYPQGYDTYGYAPPPAQDPNMYGYSAYQGYGGYQQQQVV